MAKRSANLTKKRKAQSSQKGATTTRGGTKGGSTSRSRSNSKAKKSGTRTKRAGTKKGEPRRFNLPKIQFRFDIHQKVIVVGFILIILVLLSLLSMFSSNQGRITGGFINLIWSMFGWGGPVAFVMLGLGGFWLVLWGMRTPPKISWPKWAGFGLLFLVLEGFASLFSWFMNNGLDSLEEVTAVQSGGGWLGYLISQSLIDFVGTPAGIFVLTVLGLVAVFMLSGLRWVDLQFETVTEPALETPVAEGEQAPLPLGEGVRSRSAVPSGRPVRSGRVGSAAARAAEAAEEIGVAPEPEPEKEEEEEQTLPPRPFREPKRKRSGRSSGARSSKPTGKPIRDKEKAKKVEPPREPVRPEPIFQGRNTAQVRSWALPLIADLLNLGIVDETSDVTMHQQAIVIEETLTSFGAPGQVVDIKHGPTIIQYCVEPKYLEQRSGKRTKVKVGKIASLADDLALALAARSVRIQAPVPGEAYVGIEVPNEAKNIVSLRDVMEDDGFAKVNKKSKLAVGLGEDVSGRPVTIDLAKMPHMLIAGATGSGKSVCINATIACLLLQNTPEDLKLVMVDPKRVELTGYNGIPHLAAPVVVDMDRVVGTLQWALREMDERYKKFAEVGARNIIDFNQQQKRRSKGERLPYIVIIVDELADLMMMAPDETERSIARLAQMARATGIHMILATQRPSVDVVTGLIKANFPARVAFAVASSTDSRVVLDTTGAERLLGQGDMLFQSPDAPAPVRLQGCYVSDGELAAIIDYWKGEMRRAKTEIHHSPNSNFYSAATEVVKRSELDQDVWDVESEAQRAAKKEMDEIIRSQDTMTLGPSNMATESPAVPVTNGEINGAVYLPPGEAVDESYDTKHDQAADAELGIPVHKGRAARAAKEKRVKRKEEEEREEGSRAESPAAGEEVAQESQPPLWEEMRSKLEEEQELALAHKQYGNDELWDDVLAFVLEKRGASTSMLQRRFRIGYTRAARLIDRMEDTGIIGPPTGTSKQREVYLDKLNEQSQPSDESEADNAETNGPEKDGESDV